jgi:hypothetical protein
MVDGLGSKGVPPDHAGAGLGPWTFRVGSVDSFGRSFDLVFSSLSVWTCLISKS